MLALLIRHAAVAAQDRIGLRAELPLTETGRAQAQKLAEALRTREIDAIFTSPLRRTMETANAIAGERRLAVIIEPALVEVNPGVWENRRFDELAADPSWRLFNAFRSGTRLAGGEMMIEVQARAVAFLEKISHEYRERSVAVVTHADVIRAILCHYVGIPLDLALRVEINPASLTVLQLEEWGARLISLNNT